MSLDAAIKQMNLHAHASIVLLGAATADQQLQDAIITKMKKISRKLEDELFTAYGPLSSLSAKIAVAYALDLVDATAYKRLTVARQIRNKFAHANEFITFESTEIAKLLAKFPPDCDRPIQGYEFYVWHLEQVEKHLVKTAGPHIRKPSSKRSDA
jgi:DNA-binding MltR family transcriptional regulator